MKLIKYTVVEIIHEKKEQPTFKKYCGVKNEISKTMRRKKY